jgi:hypothetical protein
MLKKIYSIAFVFVLFIGVVANVWAQEERQVEYSYILPDGKTLTVTSDKNNPTYDSFKLSIDDEEIPITNVSRFRDGGTTIIRTAQGDLFVPSRFGSMSTSTPSWQGATIVESNEGQSEEFDESTENSALENIEETDVLEVEDVLPEENLDNVSNTYQCKVDIALTLDKTIGVTADATNGYLQQLSNLMSTSLPSYLLIEEVQQLARDAQIELQGICTEVGRFAEMSEHYVVAYQLSSCKALTDADTTSRSQLITECQGKVTSHLDTFLKSLREYVLKQAIRTSVEPVVVRMRSLNERLMVLVTEYSRLVNNFYTFSLRLGDTITGERD